MGVKTKNEVVRIAVGFDGMRAANGHYMRVDFNIRLQYRGSDFIVYANTGYTENRLDTSLLVSIMNQLLTPTSAISSVHVTAFTVGITANATAKVDEIMDSVTFAAQYAGYKVEPLS